jgi:hypothetical protein
MEATIQFICNGHDDATVLHEKWMWHCMNKEDLKILTTAAAADLQSISIPPPRAPPAFPSMVHHLQVIKELKSLFDLQQKQQDKENIQQQQQQQQQLTAYSPFIAASTESLPPCATMHQPNQQSIIQSTITTTFQSTVINTNVKADIRTDQLIKLSSTHSYQKPIKNSYHTITLSFKQSFLEDSLQLSNTASIIAASLIRDSLILIFDPGGGYIQS